MNHNWIVLLICIISTGCFDIFQEKEQILVGNISLINPNNQEDIGYRMVLNEENFNSNILEDYVTDISGNDTLLIVKGVGKETCDEVFYKITHRNGKKPLTITTLNVNEYNSSIKIIKHLYSFHCEAPRCR